MFLVSQVLDHKAEAATRTVASVRTGTSVLDAAQIMNDEHIGSLVVLNAEGKLAGIITERDFLRRVIAAEKLPSETLVDDVMTENVLTCEPETRLSEIRGLMREKRVRHMPVVKDDSIVGMVSIGDLNFAESHTLHEQVDQLETYIRT